MANVRFNVDRGSLFLVYDLRPNDRVKLSLREKVDRKHWSVDKQRVRSTHPDASRINVLMDRLTDYINQVRIDKKITGDFLTSDELKNMIRSRLGLAVGDSVYESAGLIDREGSSGKVYAAAIAYWQERYPVLRWQDINGRWIHSALSRIKQEKSTSTSAIYLGVIRRMGKEALKVGIHANPIFKDNDAWKLDIKVTSDKIRIAHTMEEVKMLYDFFTKTEEGREKDILWAYLKGIFTGQRNIDWQKLNDENIHMVNGAKVLSIVPQKNAKAKGYEQVNIPVFKSLETLLEYTPARVYSPTSVRRWIGKICIDAGVSPDRANHVGTHTARRTFATIMWLAGVDKELIMQVTGHTTEQMLRKYIRVTQLEKAIMVKPIMEDLFGGLTNTA